MSGSNIRAIFIGFAFRKRCKFFRQNSILTTRQIKLSATSMYILGTDLNSLCDNIIIYKRLKEIRIADIHHLFDLIIDFGNLFICLIVYWE